MKYQKTFILLVPFLLFLTICVSQPVAKPENKKGIESQPVQEKQVGNATPGALFSSLEKIIDQDIDLSFVSDEKKFPTIVFEKITKAEFEGYQKSYRPKLDQSLARVPHTKTSFTIPTAKARLVFNRGWENRIQEGEIGYYYAEYMGFYPELGLYAVGVNGSAAIEWGMYLLIDSKTNIVYSLYSIGDGPWGAHSVSPQNTFLVHYDNQLVHLETFIGLIRISENPRRYQPYASFELEGHHVKKLVWINDHAFAVQLQIGYPGSSFKYLKTKDLRLLAR